MQPENILIQLQQSIIELRRQNESQKQLIEKLKSTSINFKFLTFEQKYNELYQENQRLLKEIAYYNGIGSMLLESISIEEKQDIFHKFTRSDNPINYEYELIPQFKFITITFDPTKFGYNNGSEKEKLYILQQLLYIKYSSLITSMYGCFEFQQNGTIHAHLIACSNDEIKLKKLLKKSFTDNPRNEKAIQVGPLKKAGIDYINKPCPYGHPKEWFTDQKVIIDNDLDHGII